MSNHRLLGGVAATALAIGGLAAVAVPASAVQHATTTTITTTVAGNGWVANAQGPGSGTITGAVAPGGRDAAELTTQGDGTIMALFGTSYIGTKFADVSGLTYDTYVANSNQAILAPSIGFEVWGGTGNSFLGSMVYEPYVADPGQPVQQDAWQTWDTMAPGALWWSSKAILNPDNSVLYPAQSAHTLADFEAAFAAYPARYSNLNTKDGIKTYVGESIMSPGWDGFDAYVDDVHVTTQGASASDTDWNFTTGIGPCAATVDDNTSTYTLTQDCSTFGTINVPDGWTIDGNGHTLTAIEDASHQNFPGPILLSATGTDSGAASMNVTNLDIETSGFGNGNSGGQLAGIKFDRAGGSVSNVIIDGVSHGNGVQEGIGLYVRNRDGNGSYAVPPTTIAIDNVTVTDYQKSGIILDGNLGFTLTNSTIGQAAGPDGTPLTSIAANAIQISRIAHGTVSGNHIALNEYNPSPPPGDSSDATAILVYDAKTVTISDNVIEGGNGDVGIDAYNDTDSVVDTHVIASCNLFSRSETQGDYDPYGVGIAQWADGSTPVEVDLSDSTFSGWNHDTSSISFDQGGNMVFGPGAADQSLGACAPSAPSNVAVSGGDGQTDVTWDPSTGTDYAPLDGYTVTATDSHGNVVSSQQVDANTTTAHLNGLANGQDYTVSVVANGGGGDSVAGTATLHATSLTLSAADSQIGYGTKTSLNGVLSSTDPGAHLAGRQVTIQSEASGSGNSWTTLATKSVDSTGAYSLQINPTANTDYRVLYAGAPDLASVSPTATVNVAMSLKVRLSSHNGHVGKKLSFTGVVSPNHEGYPVELQQRVQGIWTNIQTTTLDPHSSFGFHWKASTPGTFNFRVMADGDATHVDGFSKIFKVTIH